MQKETLIPHFRLSLAELFENSSAISRNTIHSIYYQSAPVQSLFANMAVNTDPKQPVSDEAILKISEHFHQLNLSYLWVVNEDDDPHLTKKLLQHQFTHFTDIECLHYHISQPLPENSNLKITKVKTTEKPLFKEVILHTFEGTQPPGVEFVINEVYFNPNNPCDCFFAYLDNIDFPVAYAATIYGNNGPLAMLSGSATAKEHRGKGIYAALLSHRINQALKLGKTDFIIEAMAKTSAPRCKKFGFTKVFEQAYYKR